VERIIAGLEKRNRLLNPWERQIVAYHEMGHAMLAYAMPGADRVHKVSIIPRGIGSLGYTIQRPIDDRFLMTKQELENKIAILLGGRAAELVVFNHLSTGAANDLMRATEIAHSMVTRYGMSEKLGSMAYERENRSLLATPGMPRSHDRDYGEETARAVDDETRKIVEAALQRARRILEERREVLDHSARRLLDKETIDKAELIELIGPPAASTLSLAAE
jgi:cell division protease FtsH